MPSFTGRTLEEAMIKAAVTTCKPCCTASGMPVCGGCEACCTLSATLQLPAPGNPNAFGTAFDVELYCDRSFEVWNGATQCYYLDPETEEGDSYYIDRGVSVYSGASGTTTEAGVEYTYLSNVWASDEFVYDGVTYKLVLSVETRDYIDPITELPAQYCGYYLELLKLTNFTSDPFYDFGDQWCRYAKVINTVAPDTEPTSPWFTIVTDTYAECTEPYSEIDVIGCGGPCNGVWPGYDTYNMDQDFDGIIDCPIYMESEIPNSSFTPKCWKIQLFDLCDEEPVDLLDSFPDDPIGDEF